MTLNTKQVKKKYNRYSKFYDVLEGSIESRLFKAWRKNLVKSLKGKILEIGVGTGNNLEFYTKDAKVTAIDLSPGMLSKAKKKLKKLNQINKSNKNISLQVMDAQDLKFKNNTFDYVICTFVLCSVPKPKKALREMNRVLKNTGKFIMIEHVLSRYTLIALGQHLHNPIAKHLLGFNVNRNTKKNIKKTGIKIIKDEKLAFFDIFRKFTCLKNTNLASKDLKTKKRGVSK